MNKLVTGENDLATRYPELISEWCLEKNSFLPSEITYGSKKKVWWKCDKGHEWQASINNRTGQGQSCPYCANKRVLVGFNDFASQYPELLKEWDNEKNDRKPTMILPGSSQKVYWRCSNGHSWKASVKNRCFNHQGCPFCHNVRVLTGFNDLVTKRPDIVKEWDYDKNINISPDEILPGSNKKVWWICNVCGKSWSATPHARTSKNSGCPACYKRQQTSFPEQAIYYYIKKQFPDAINGFTDTYLGKMSLDVYIPSMKIGIEYDGLNWHSSKASLSRDIEKNRRCKERGITLIRVYEKRNQLHKESDSNIASTYHIDGNIAMNEVIKKLFAVIGIDYSPNIELDKNAIIEQYTRSLREESLDILFPYLSQEWNTKQNGNLRPSMFLPQSHVRVWWKCQNGHEWEATIYNRTHGNGCPYCSGRIAIKGYNDLLTMNPPYIHEWNYSKNTKVRPTDVTINSNKKAWWLCQKGHEWEAAIYSRTQGTNCPYCAGKKVIPGENDLASLYPDIALQWSEKNLNILPNEVTACSNKRIWWKCKKGHEWQATPADRVLKKTGCPYCANRRVLAGYNDLKTTAPHLICEWNYERNIISPDEITANSHKKVWWICNKGHEWEAYVYNRSKGARCPYCSGKRK